MAVDLLPTLLPWLVGFAVVAGVGVLLAVAVLADVVRRERPVRKAQHQTIPAYYGRLLLGH